MAEPAKFRCVRCRAEFGGNPRLSTCPRCHRDVDRPGLLEPVYPAGAVAASLRAALGAPPGPGLARWAGCLPVPEGQEFPSLGEGNTPLLRAERLAEQLGFQGELYIKNETVNPTGSYKDRLAWVVTSVAARAGARRLALVSSGNMGAAVAAFSALLGLETVVIVSPTADPAKVVQARMFGATVVRVAGNEGERLRLLEEAVAEFGWYNANSPLNPYGPEGAKTAAYEEWEQLGGRVPDWVVIPVGFGCNFAGHWRGYGDLVAAGVAATTPRLAAVQAEGSPSVVVAYAGGKEEAEPGPEDTIASGIAQRVTLHSRTVLRALRESRGTAIAVTDEEILAAQGLLARSQGVFAEPSGAAAVAGFAALVRQGRMGTAGCAVVVVTGSGLKDIRRAAEQVGERGEILEPSLPALAKHVAALPPPGAGRPHGRPAEGAWARAWRLFQRFPSSMRRSSTFFLFSSTAAKSMLGT